MKLKLCLNSASELKNVNWRYGYLQPYAIAWIDSSGKCSTKVDENNGENPVWNEKFSIQLPPTSHPDTAILYIDIVHANPAADTKPLVGSAKLPFRVALNEACSKGKALFSLILERPSGRPQGILEIQIEIKDSNNQPQPVQQRQPQPQPIYQHPPQPRPQPQPQLPMQQYQPQVQPRPIQQYQPQVQPRPIQQYQPQVQPRPIQQYQPQPQPMAYPQSRPQQINQYRNVPVAVRPGYPANSPQNFRPNVRPKYRPVNQQPSLGLTDALCTLAFVVNPTQIKRMAGSVQRIQASVFKRAQAANNNGVLVSGDNGTYGNDPSAAQGYDNAGYDDGSYIMGDSDNMSFDGSYVDGQFSTDGGFGDGGMDMSGLDMSGLDMSGFDMSQLDLGSLA